MDIAIIGPGRFGHYLAQKLMQLDHDVHFVGLENGGLEADEILQHADLTVFAVPIRALADALMAFSSSIRDGTTVIDVCTVKQYPLEIMRKAFANRPVTVVGTHPLFGPQSAPVIKPEHKVAICPVQGDDEGKVADLFSSLCATPVRVSAEEHDRQQCQQMIDHFLGRAAIRAGVERVELSTKTHELFMNVVDIIGGNSQELFEDMNAYNPFARKFRSHFMSALIDIHSDLCIREEAVRPEAYAHSILRKFRPAYLGDEVPA